MQEKPPNGRFFLLFGHIHIAKAKGQQLCHSGFLITGGRNHVDFEIVTTEFPHHLPAYAAGRKLAGDDAILTAADGDGNKIPVTVVDRLEDGGTLGADGGGIGGVFDVAAGVDRSVGTE